ncbi:DNA polymerase III subunit delta [Moraxella oblonga]|uniref:DNA polymerase III subunit delta n=1 Tax=Moraxella oblonga TaxID=200413 RepID=UPI00082B3C0C|nr:DNA polymerase III subunit delta [Moraxella oblonga]
MQTRLLPLLYDLKRNAVALNGLWLLHTDNPVVADWLIEACRPAWTAQGQFAKRMELTSPKSWHEVVNELFGLSLFDETTVLIVSGNHKPDTKDKALMSSLNRFTQDVKDKTNQNQLIWCLPKQDKKSLATKAMQFFDMHGLIIDGNIYDEKLRGEFLHLKAQELGLTLDDMAWQMLMNATEKNLLTAYQTLWRLSFLPHADVVGADELEQALVAGVDFNVFDLSDALLTANAPKTLQILNHLQHTDIAPSIVLWAVAKEARLILQIQAGKNPSELGVWQSKLYLYLNIAQRTQGISGDWLSQIYAIDKAIKGVSGMDVWGEIERLCLAMCGVN